MTADGAAAEAAEEITYEVADQVAWLTINRPDARNALNKAVRDGLWAGFRRFAEDDSAAVLILTGAGGKAFCAGGDLKEMAGAAMKVPPPDFLPYLQRTIKVDKPVIAAVNGAAAGGGLGLALAADIRVASTEARFNAAFVRIGLSAGDVGVSWSLPRVVGLGHAAEIMLTGEFVDAERAERIGLVNRVVAPGELLDVAFEVADRIAANTPFGVMLTKRVLQANVDAGSLRQAIEVENRGQTLATRGEDFREALAAFRAKRAPQFAGR